MKKTASGRTLGWVKDLPDHRDYYRLLPATTYPDEFDLRPSMPPVYDQGDLGSCTANALAGLIEYDLMKQATPVGIVPSRLFLYYNERDLEGTTGYDSGAEIRDGIKTLSAQGICPEGDWPYNISDFTVKPTDNCYTDALQYTIVQYARVSQTDEYFKATLSSGFPIAFGFSVYENFENQVVNNNGLVTVPDNKESLLGGHAVLLVGYTKDYYIVRNSWGIGFGIAGYFYMDPMYLKNPDLSSDFWTVELVK
jgi:C1A family cysteine protease